MDTTLSDPVVGRLLDGRYRVHRLLASGGMASVYLATDSRLDRQVAVKVMHPGFADDPEFVARFVREARAAAALNHPNIVAVYDQGSDDGLAFLVMEYVDGATLLSVLREHGHFTPGQAIAVMDHVLAGLGHAHAAGLVHRDVKPGNVLVTGSGRVKVVDFGLARAAAGSSVTTAGTGLIGTPHYLAPEQIEKGTSDARSDVFAAGVMLFELLTGSPPFAAESLQSVTYRVVHDDVPEPSSRVDGVPAELDAIVLAATARDPFERPRDAHALHESLLSVRDRLGLHDHVPTPSATVAVPRHDTLVVDRGDVPTVVPAAAAVGAPPADGTTTGVRRRRRRWPWVLAALLVAAIVAGVAGWYLAVGRYTSAPSVLGLTKPAAAAKLHAAGLKVRWLPSVYSDSIDRDLVAKESPAPGHDLRKGGTVAVALSLGRDHVPDIRGKDVETASRLLAKAQLLVGTTTKQYSDKVDKGLVITTTPKPGAEISPRSQVDLVVSQGPAPVTVPDVRNKPEDQATAILQGVGLLVNVTRDFDDKVKSGNVITTTPKPGTTARRGDTVTVLVSQGPHLYDVPDVTDMKIDDAIKKLRAAGFVPQPHEVLPFGPGRVLRETPTGKQPRGTTITLYYF